MVKQRYKHEIVGGEEFRRRGSNLSLPHIHKGDCLAQRGLSSYYLACTPSIICKVLSNIYGSYHKVLWWVFSPSLDDWENCTQAGLQVDCKTPAARVPTSQQCGDRGRMPAPTTPWPGTKWPPARLNVRALEESLGPNLNVPDVQLLRLTL